MKNLLSLGSTDLFREALVKVLVMDSIQETITPSLSEGPSARLRAMVPFSSQIQEDQALLVGSSSFAEANYGSPQGMKWEATSVVTRTSHGNYKLYICHRRGLTMWIPYGDWFISNQSTSGIQSIGELARKAYHQAGPRNNRGAWKDPSGRKESLT